MHDGDRMSDDQIRYDVLVQDALRGVVRKVLGEVARTGLPGDHHFFIAFDTRAPGVRISSRLRERYPEEMTVVVQHQYWDLSATEHAFEVGLSFSGIPERLLIPYSAIKGFFDPSVKFGLEFEVVSEADEDEDAESAPAGPVGVVPVPSNQDGRQAAPASPVKLDKAPEPPVKAAEADPPVGEGDKGTASVVSLDQFRKKP
jgi:hypothetical protein